MTSFNFKLKFVIKKHWKILIKWYNQFMENYSGETIVAISTGSSSGAIAIVRLSGQSAINIADEIFVAKIGKKPSEFEPRMLYLGKLETENFSEECMCVCFASPNSYTGENLVEFQCHGGTKIASGIFKECVKKGARPATNGEFTKRAFMNGKMSLSSAEGMMDMINAESDAEIRAGYSLLSGNLSKLAYTSQEELTDVLSEIEVSFDYPEETIEYITKAKVKERLETLSDNIKKVLDTADAGKIIKDGINAVIVGKPNVGKSSLLNTLLKQEKAIVTNIPGTTRDVVEGTFLLDDIKINLTDTAGIRETDDTVEKIGVDKAKNLINQADIVLFLVDQNQEFSSEDEEIFNSIKNLKYIVVKTKADLENKLNKTFENEIVISSKTGTGLDDLKAKLIDILKLSNISNESVIITNERHKDALLRALKSLQNACKNIGDDSLDLVSIDIKDAYLAIGEITGNTTSEDIIDSIFEKFCLGK